jgi:hypothetical protein
VFKVSTSLICDSGKPGGTLESALLELVRHN